jgi:hypothetical protein
MKPKPRIFLTFQISPKGGVETLILLEYDQQTAARTTQSMHGAPEAQKKERKKPPHLGSVRTRRREMEERKKQEEN